jgi:hypothetical protein
MDVQLTKVKSERQGANSADAIRKFAFPRDENQASPSRAAAILPSAEGITIAEGFQDFPKI